MPTMEQRNIVAFNFVRRQSETALMTLKRNSEMDHNANMKTQQLVHIRKGGVGRSLTFTPHDSTASRVPQRITLPERFRRKIRRKNSSNNLLAGVIVNGTSLTNIDESDLDEIGLDWEDRKSDMERAIAWVRQELMRLREQDRVIVKRFLDLHTTMQQFKAIRSCPSLDADARSHTSLSTSSWLSLDDGHFGYTPVHQRNNEDILIALSHCPQTNHHLHKLVMTHCSNMRDLNISHSDSNLQARTVSLSDIYSGEAGRFAKYIQDSPEMGRFAKYNHAALSQPESLDEDSEDEYNNTLTKQQPHFRIDTEYEDTSENALENAHVGDDFDDIFTSDYTDTLTKAPTLTNHVGDDESFECDSLEEYDCDTLTRNKDKKRDLVIDTGITADEITL